MYSQMFMYNNSVSNTVKVWIYCASLFQLEINNIVNITSDIVPFISVH